MTIRWQAKRLAPDFFFQQQVYREDGGIVLLPPGEPNLATLLELIDGLILSGGGDVDLAVPHARRGPPVDALVLDARPGLAGVDDPASADVRKVSKSSGSKSGTAGADWGTSSAVASTSFSPAPIASTRS